MRKGIWAEIGQVMILLTIVVLVSAIGSTARAADEQLDRPRLTDPTVAGYEHPIENYDPWEGFNRSMYRFNYGFDKYVFLPVVRAYEFVLPDMARQGISNFFSNLYEIKNLVNNLLQGKAEGTVNTTARMVFNTTLGLGGLLDPATEMGFPQADEDFGQTLGVWGLGPGPYLVLPVVGPSSVRDTGGLAVDAAVRAVWVGWLLDELDLSTGDEDKLYWGLTGLYTISKRHDIPFRYYETGSPFEYELVRYVYLKYREIAIER